MKKAENTKWNTRFIELAKLIGSWSKDPNRPIGAVIVDKNNRIVSTGYNGFATGILDTEERLENKDIKRTYMIHAEQNAILYSKRDLTGCKIYIYGYSPCTTCSNFIIQAGITEVIFKNSKGEGIISEYWKNELKTAEGLLLEAGVALKEIK